MSRERRLGGLSACLVLVPSLVAAGVVAGEDRFVATSRLALGGASWMTLDGDRVVFGEGTRLLVARATASPVAGEPLALEEPVTSAVLAGDFLYLARADGRIELRPFGSIEARGLAARLDPEPRGQVRLGRMTDYLLLVEEGWGLRLLEIVVHPTHGADHEHHASPGALRPVGDLPLAGSFVAVAASGNEIYLADGAGRVLRIDASDPSRPRVDREIAVPGEVRALAAAGSLLYILDAEGLRVFDVSGEAVVGVSETPLGGGRAVEVAGRSVFVAGDEGLVALRDGRSTAATFIVSVQNNLFQPSVVNVAPGDTVTWNKTTTTGQHNVESCDGAADPAGCGGVVAVEGEFSSGGPTFGTFTFSFVFNAIGSNPYFCAVHELFGMRGRVEVNAPSPPGVPDGSVGTLPMLVGKNDPQGTSLTISWDTNCSGDADYHLVLGSRAQLPAVLGGTYGVGGSLCNVGGVSPVIFNPSPLPPAGDFMWWLMVADDDATVEGSWGRASNGLERTGPLAGGASGVCGIASKSLTNTCGQ